MTGIEIRDEDSLRRAARRFLDMGVEQVFLSLGSKGVFCADHHEQFHLPAYPSHMVNSTGAGDSFMAALAWGWRQGFRAGLRQGRAGRGRHLHRKRRDDQSAHQRGIHPGNHGGAHTDPDE